MNKIIEVKTKEEIEELGSALTLEGLAEESIPEFLDWIEERTPLKTRRAYTISGKLMNESYRLTKDNAYSNSLTIVSVKLEDMEDPDKIIMARFEICGRWLDDIIENNIAREERN